MNASPDNGPSSLPVYDAGKRHTYSLEILTEITGLESTTILHYQEHGLIAEGDYDDEAVHTLRRIEHLRGTCEANVSGLKLILGLMDEVDRLKSALRTRS